jgi:hypothetical protein
MRARLMTVATLVYMSSALLAAEASAATRGNAYVPPGGDPTASARDEVGGAGAPGGTDPGSEDPCYWAVIVEDDSKFFVYDFADPTKVVHSATGRWLEHRCPSRGAVEVGGSPLVPEGGLIDPVQLALEAVSSVQIGSPVIRTSPSEGGRLFVHVPTWLWIDRQWWQGYEATASAGRVNSTVRAVPRSATWTLGDGSTTTCAGPGLAWEAGRSEDATDCSHTYMSSSGSRPGGTLDLSVAVTFEVTWTTNVGEGGSLAPLTRTSTRTVEVTEIQAIGTSR